MSSGGLLFPWNVDFQIGGNPTKRIQFNRLVLFNPEERFGRLLVAVSNRRRLGQMSKTTRHSQTARHWYLLRLIKRL